MGRSVIGLILRGGKHGGGERRAIVSAPVVIAGQSRTHTQVRQRAKERGDDFRGRARANLHVAVIWRGAKAPSVITINSTGLLQRGANGVSHGFDPQ